MQVDKRSLRADGFAGFRTFAEVEINRIPQAPGIFAVLRPAGFEPQFLTRSTAGVFKRKDPSLPAEKLTAEWVDASDILYIGKAGVGSKGNRGLRRQIQEFMDFGKGKPPGHWDGRLIWQLANTQALVIAWKELPAEQLPAGGLGAVEAELHAAFVQQYGRLPFANLVQARAKA